MNIEDKINIVKDILKDKKVAIGFSGGADSTLIAYLASQVSKDVLAITIDNHMMPDGFIEHTQRMALRFGIKQHIIDLNFYDDEDFLDNTSSRCYMCRNWMYDNILNYAKSEGFDFICDGNNISDLVIDRPGILVTYKKKFKTPFITAKLTSKEIHQYLNENNIAYSRSTTCLATRIPTNTKLTRNKIDRIRYCESYIHNNYNCDIVKVRDLDGTALLEVENFDEIMSMNSFNDINDKFKSKEFKKVALNLSELDDDEEITIDFHGDSFKYQLPFTINIENTKNQLSKKVIISTDNKITVNNLTVDENGLITGKDFNSYDEALDKFMDLLQDIRRNI